MEATPTYEYDPRADALIVKLRPGHAIARTVEIDDSRFVDIDDGGHVVEIEVLGASTGVKLSDLVDRFQLWDLKPFLEEVVEASKGFKPRSFA